LNIYKIHERSACLYVFKNKEQYELTENIYSTRNNGSLRASFQRLSCCKKSVYHNAPSLFNLLPREISSLESMNKFKIESKKRFIICDVNA